MKLSGLNLCFSCKFTWTFLRESKEFVVKILRGKTTYFESQGFENSETEGL